MLILSRNIARNINTCLNSHLSFRTDEVRTSQKCVCIYTAVYSQTLTAISIFKYVNIVCIIQVHTRSCDFTAHMCTGMILSNYKLFVNPLFKLISIEHVIIGSKTTKIWNLHLKTGDRNGPLVKLYGEDTCV